MKILSVETKLLNVDDRKDRHHEPNSPFSVYLSRYSDSLQAGQRGDENLVGVRFSALIQTGPGAHPGSYKQATGLSHWYCGRGVALTTTPSSAKVKERVELYICSP